MNIYICHSRKSDFKKELYKPIRESELNNQHNIILPHEYSDEYFNSRKYLKEKADLILVECSNSTISMGIEIGWADSFEVPILCIYKKGAKPSGSLKIVTNNFIEYENSDDMIRKINDFLKNQIALQ